MDFTYSDEQRLLTESLEKLLGAVYDFDRRRAAAAAGGYRADVWRQFAEMGLLALAVPESRGGFGATLYDQVAVAETLGRFLVLEPVTAVSCVAAPLLARSGGHDALLQAVMAGETLVVPAIHEPAGRHDLQNPAMTATPARNGYRLSGIKTNVPAAPFAAHYLVSARVDGGEGLALFLVGRETPGISVTGYGTLDGASAGLVRFEHVEIGAGALAAGPDEARSRFAEAIDDAAILAMAEAVSAMEKLNEMTIGYMKTRRQFGRFLADFQVVRHRLADMSIAAGQARSALYHALSARMGGDPARARAVSLAKIRLDEAGMFIGEQAVQLHGGIGMTDELAVSHYYKRLITIAAAWGGQHHHVARASEIYRRIGV